MFWGVFASNHLGIDVRFAAVKIADFFTSGRIDAGVIIVSAIAIANARFSDDDPGIIVAEDASVFLVTRWVRGDLTEFEMVLGVGGLLQDDAMLGGQEFVRGFKCS